jgi:hypothetical protein
MAAVGGAVRVVAAVLHRDAHQGILVRFIAFNFVRDPERVF